MKPKKVSQVINRNREEIVQGSRRQSPATGWSTEEIDDVKRALDRLMREGNRAADPSAQGSFPPVCPDWTWQPEFGEQYNAIVGWLIGEKRKCQGRYVLPGRGLWLAGNPGTGKTTLMVAVKRFCSIFEDESSPNLPRPMVWKHAKEIVSDYEREGAAAIHRLSAQVKTLIIDDLGTESRETMRYGNVKNVVEEVLSRRYDKKLMTMVTTNLTMDQVKDVYRARIYDRVRESFNIVEFVGASYRKNFNPEI